MSTYRGRFAPSPSGPLHFGSMLAALGSYLEAKQHNGEWLLRIENVDTPRTVPGSSDDIMRTLECYGLYWDGAVLYQSQRTEAYQLALNQLQQSGMVYLCACSRKEIADSALRGIEGQIYPGTCRNGVTAGRVGRAWRVRSDISNQNKQPDSGIVFQDAIQGRIYQELEAEIGDFVIKRADRLFAYQLAVVVDDAFQQISHVVRGADLLSSTPRQIYLQQHLGFTTPTYMHLPVAINQRGEKLSKQTLAEPASTNHINANLWQLLEALQQQPPVALRSADKKEIMNWAIAHWDAGKLAGVKLISVC